MSTFDHATPEECARVLTVLRSARRPFTKDELRQRTGLAERTVRAAINSLTVVEHHPIVTDRTHGGYELTGDGSKISAEIARLTSHGSEILKRAHALEAHLGVNLSLFGGSGA